MLKLGKDIDIFGGLLDEEVSDQTPTSDADKDTNNTGADDQTANNKEGNTMENSNNEIDSSDENKESELTGNDKSADGEEDTSENKMDDTSTSDDSNIDESNKEEFSTETQGDNKIEDATKEVGDILDDLLEDVNDKLSESDDNNQTKMLEELQKSIQEGQLRIKELEEENKIFQDKYFEKFSESSEYNLMKPYIDTIQSDPELFLLVKSIKGENQDGKLNNLISMVEKETGVNIKDYLSDNGKSSISAVTSTKSGGDMSEGTNDVVFEDPKPFKESLY